LLNGAVTVGPIVPPDEVAEPGDDAVPDVAPELEAPEDVPALEPPELAPPALPPDDPPAWLKAAPVEASSKIAARADRRCVRTMMNSSKRWTLRKTHHGF